MQVCYTFIALCLTFRVLWIFSLLISHAMVLEPGSTKGIIRKIKKIDASYSSL